MAAGDATLGEIRFFAGSFAPKNWMYCAGQLIAIRQNTALFSIIGVQYGGDGKVTFALPDLGGNVVLGAGGEYEPGMTGGSTTSAITINNMPPHSHPFQGTISKLCSAAAGNVDSPQNNSPAMLPGEDLYTTTTDGSLMAPMKHSLGVGFSTGGGQPFNSCMPLLGLSPAICVAGIFPVRG